MHVRQVNFYAGFRIRVVLFDWINFWVYAAPFDFSTWVLSTSENHP